jgi:hypothetical protein
VSVIFNEPNAAYHANKAISSSNAKSALKSAQLFLDERNGLVPRYESAAMKLGTAIHARFLEPETYDDLYVVQPDGIDGRTKAGKEWKAENSDKIVLSRDDHQTISMLCRRVPSEVVEIFTNYMSEVTVRCKHDGLAVQCRFDSILHNDVADLKTTSNFDDFDAQAAKLRYDFSAGWYNMVWQAETITESLTWQWVVCETVAPWRWKIVTLPNYILEECTDEARMAVGVIKDAIKGIVENRCHIQEWSRRRCHNIVGLV